MFRLFVRVWHYTGAALTHLFNERADPRIQIERAIEEARENHMRVIDGAAGVFSSQAQIEIRLMRSAKEMRELDARTVTALRLAEAARKNGDAKAVGEYERAAELFAAELAAKESSITDLREMQSNAEMLSAGAQRAIEQNKMQLHRQLLARTHLLNDLAAADMQRRMAESFKAMDALAPRGVTPTLPEMRERIDKMLSDSAAQLRASRDSTRASTLDVESALALSQGQDVLNAIRAREGLPVGEEQPQ